MTHGEDMKFAFIRPLIYSIVTNKRISINQVCSIEGHRPFHSHDNERDMYSNGIMKPSNVTYLVPGWQALL